LNYNPSKLYIIYIYNFLFYVNIGYKKYKLTNVVIII